MKSCNLVAETAFKSYGGTGDAIFTQPLSHYLMMLSFSADCSIYNSFGRAFMSFMNALMTYEPGFITEASAVLDRACETIDKFRHKVWYLVDLCMHKFNEVQGGLCGSLSTG